MKESNVPKAACDRDEDNQMNDGKSLYSKYCSKIVRNIPPSISVGNRRGIIGSKIFIIFDRHLLNKKRGCKFNNK